MASHKGLSHLAQLAGSSGSIGKSCNNVDEPYVARPVEVNNMGAKFMSKYRVTVLEKGLPFSAHCTLTLLISLALYPPISPGQSTNP